MESTRGENNIVSVNTAMFPELYRRMSFKSERICLLRNPRSQFHTGAILIWIFLSMM